MNKLWVRLSIAFSSVVLVAVLVVITSGIIVSQADRFFDFRDELRTPGGLVDELAAHYRQHHSWQGVEPLLVGARATFRAGREGYLTLILADSAGNIIYHPRSRNVGRRLDPATFDQAVPIEVDGKPVGYLALAPPFDEQARTPRPPYSFLSSILISFAVAGGVVGIVFGVLVSRTLAAPLKNLANSARAIGARDLSRRVEVKGSDEMKEVAQAFNEMASGLEQSEQLRRNLLADVAHELRTPLTVVQGNLRAMLDGVYNLDETEVARLYEQTRLLSRLVNDLHELAQAEAKQLTLNFQETDLIQLVTTIANTFSPLAEENRRILQTNLPESLPVIQVDRARLSQVLHNLLSNALRHTPEGGKIIIRAEATPSAICLDVSDTGDGIPPEHLPHIFDRFYRTDPARSRDKGGAGLGLAIARAIIEAHGGQISARSDGESGKGTTFAIQLPLFQA